MKASFFVSHSYTLDFELVILLFQMKINGFFGFFCVMSSVGQILERASHASRVWMMDGS